jgi:hypothetical protein
MINVGLITDHQLDTWTSIHCLDLFKPESGIPDWLDTYEGGRYAAGSARLWFEREHDALVFTLMWVK